LTRNEVREIVATMNQALEAGNLAGIRPAPAARTEQS
jgi:hypothetical protein